MYNLPKIWRVLLSLVFCFMLFVLLFASPVHAYPGASGPDQWQQAIDSDKFNKESFDSEGITNIELTVVRQAFGGVTAEAMNRNGGGAIGMLGSTIAFMYDNPPASGVTYFASVGKNLGIVKPAYAQTDQGFNRLAGEGILNIWRGFRNVSYFLFIIIFVALAFAIMFRVRLNPQTVITIQSAIPRIIIALILVTFSYAIAGLLIDLAFVSTGIVDAVFRQVTPPDLPAQIKNTILNLLLGSGAGLAVGAALAPLLLAFGGGPLAALGGFALVAVIFAILFLLAILRVLFMLLMAYIGLLFKIILSPLIILFNTLPGRPVFWGWFSSLLSDIVVFPTTYAIILLGWLLIRSIGPTLNPLVPVPTLIAPIFGILQGLLGLGILLLLPNIVNIVKEAISRALPLGGPAGVGIIRGGAAVGYQGLQYAPGIEKIIGKAGVPGVTPPEPRRAAIDALMRLLGTGRL